MSPYHYLPLASDEIRLLDLSPNDTGTEIYCSLRHVRLADNPDYEAVSYCWGDTNDQRKINCDAFVLEVTRNLHSFLSHNRHLDKTRAIWVDAICINQADVSERSAQVRLMGSIYSKAATVLVWLGEASEGSDEAMNLVNHLPTKVGTVYDALAITKTIPDDSSPVWSRLSELLERDYFHRMWASLIFFIS
jgi:hypothetical protein